jgi:hypothetical protein
MPGAGDCDHVTAELSGERRWHRTGGSPEHAALRADGGHNLLLPGSSDVGLASGFSRPDTRARGYGRGDVLAGRCEVARAEPGPEVP